MEQATAYLPETAKQLSLEGDSKIVFLRPQPKTPILFISPTRLNTAITYFTSQEHLPDPKTDPLPEHTAPLVGSMLHAIVQSTTVWRNILPLSIRGYQEAYQKKLDSIAPWLFPNTQPQLARMILDILANPRCAMPNNRDEPNRAARHEVYNIIAHAIIKRFKQLPPFTASIPFHSFSQNILDIPYPSPEKFNQLWNAQNADARLSRLVDRIFLDHEANPHLVQMLWVSLSKTVLHASELRMSTFIPEIPAMLSAVADLVVWGERAQKPRKTITVYDWKSGSAAVSNPYLTEGRLIINHCVSLMLAHLKRDKLTTRTVIEVKNALNRLPADTAVVFRYRGYGSDPPSQEEYGSYDHPVVSDRVELEAKKHRLIEMVKWMLNEKPEIARFFSR